MSLANYGPVTVMCERCKRMAHFQNISALQEFVRAQYKLLLQCSDSDGQAHARETLGEAAIANSAERIMAIIEENGMVVALCSWCRADDTERIYREMGKDIVRKGAMLFDRKFYKENRQACRRLAFGYPPPF